MQKLKTKVNNLTIKTFHFNFIQVNTFVLFDDTREAIIIDPGNYTAQENEHLAEFVQDEKLTIKYIINTHPHIDHIFGNNFSRNQFHGLLLMHEAGIPVYHKAGEYCSSYQLKLPEFPTADQYIKAGDQLHFGQQVMEVLYTPGHCDGSICLLDKKNELLFTGDLLFEGSIGRTDLPTGDFDLIMKSIREQVLVLDDRVAVYPGHGDATTIGKEKQDNPYL